MAFIIHVDSVYQTEFWNIDNLSLMHTHMHANKQQVMSHQDGS